MKNEEIARQINDIRQYSKKQIKHTIVYDVALEMAELKDNELRNNLKAIIDICKKDEPEVLIKNKLQKLLNL